MTDFRPYSSGYKIHLNNVLFLPHYLFTIMQRYWLLMFCSAAFVLLSTHCTGQPNSTGQPPVTNFLNWRDTVAIASLPPEQRAFFERKPTDSVIISMHVFRTVPFAQGSLLFAAKQINLNVTPTSSWLCERQFLEIQNGKTLVWKGNIANRPEAMISLWADDEPSVQGGYRLTLAELSLTRLREEYILRYSQQWNLWYFYRFDRLKRPNATCGTTTP